MKENREKPKKTKEKPGIQVPRPWSYPIRTRDWDSEVRFRSRGSWGVKKRPPNPKFELGRTRYGLSDAPDFAKKWRRAKGEFMSAT